MKPSRFPLLGLAFFLVCGYSFLIFHFFRLQILQNGYWSSLAAKQHCLIIKEDAPRGRFFSNPSVVPHQGDKAVVFSVDVPKYHFYVDSLNVPVQYREKIATSICDLIKAPEKKSWVIKQLSKRSRSRCIQKWLDAEQKHNIEQWWKHFAKKCRLSSNALYFSKHFQRSYPFGSLLGCVLHTIGENVDSQLGHYLPTGGLEMQFDTYLRGTPKERLLLRSPRRVIEKGAGPPPTAGSDVYLTIDASLQAICEEELDIGVRQAEAKSGWAILMDPRSGEVYAMAQTPKFDLANYKACFQEEALRSYAQFQGIVSPFEPGSTCKIITAALALLANEELLKRGQAPLFDTTEKIACASGHLKGRKADLKDVNYHKFLNLNMAIAKSSNIYIAKLVEKIIDRLGPFWYYEQLRRLGLGQKTGIEYPAEASGFLPVPPSPGKAGVGWSSNTPYSLSFGYNLLANGMQILRIFSAMVNKGECMPPTLVKKIRCPERGDLDLPKREKVRLFPEHIASVLVEAMRYVTTKRRVDIPGYSEGGKSGTVEKLKKGGYDKKEHFAYFIEFAPATHPRLILIVGVDEPPYRRIPGIGRAFFGAQCAGPICREIMKRSLSYLGIDRDDPYGYPPLDPRSKEGEGQWHREIKQLEELYQLWNQ